MPPLSVQPVAGKASQLSPGSGAYHFVSLAQLNGWASAGAAHVAVAAFTADVAAALLTPVANTPAMAVKATAAWRPTFRCDMGTHLPWWVLAAELSHPGGETSSFATPARAGFALIS